MVVFSDSGRGRVTPGYTPGEPLKAKLGGNFYEALRVNGRSLWTITARTDESSLIEVRLHGGSSMSNCAAFCVSLRNKVCLQNHLLMLTAAISFVRFTQAGEEIGPVRLTSRRQETVK
jgi:hypothetical protein